MICFPSDGDRSGVRGATRTSMAAFAMSCSSVAYRYVLLQAVGAGIVRDWREYAHTRVGVELDVGLKRALELKAFLEEVPYRRYQKWCEKRKRRQGH